MTPKRPKSLKWIGNELPDGRPERFYDDIPARDLTDEETDALSQEQLTRIRHTDPPLYREVHAPEPKKAAKRTAPKAAESRPDGAERTIGADTGDEPTPAAEPATEGEG